MKISKMRVLCVILTFVMILMSAPVTFAQDVNFDLKAMGVTSEINMERDMNGPVRRDEFAQMVVSLLGYDGITADDNVFSDISDSQYKNAIILLYEMNYVSGSSQSHFNPSNNIRYSEACKILVDVLGYSVMVSGKTLENYTFVAADIGITDGVPYDNEFVSMNGILRMLYNCLDIPRMTKVLMGDTVVSYEIAEGNTLRKQLTTGSEEVAKLKGIVTADKSTYMHKQIPSLKSTQIQINDKVYSFDGVAPLGLVGREVELFVKKVGDKEFITSIQATNKNTEVAFNTDDLNGISDNLISTLTEDGVKNKYKVNSDTVYIYNLRADRGFTPSDFNALDDADVLMVDNNEDEIFDVVFITKYSDAVVDRIYKENYRVYFKEGYKLDGNKYMDLDPTEQYVYVSLTHADGTVADFSEIKEDTVLSVAYSENGEARCAVIGGETVTGIIDTRDDYDVVIGGKAYEYNIPANDLQIGKTVTATLNFKNEVVMVEYAEAEDNFAYVYKIQNANGFGYAKTQLLIPSPVSARTEVDIDLEEGGESTTTRKLFCRNEDVEIFEFASKVRVETETNGQYKTTTYSSSNAANAVAGKVISYRVDSDGRIAYISVLNPVTELESKTYNAGQQIFGKSAGLAFGITNNETKSICIPDGVNSDPSEDDLKVFVELLNSAAYTVQGYAYDEDTYICDLIIVQATMLAGTAGNVNSKSDVGLVVKNYQKLNEDGEEVITIKMLTEDGEKDFAVSNLISARNSFLKIKEGDLIAYSQDNFENLNGYALLQDKDSFYDIAERTKATFTVFCGIVNDIKYNYPSVRRNMWVTTLYANLETGASAANAYDIINSSPAPIFLIENDNYSIITVDDVQFGDRIFVAVDNGTTRAVVVKR